MNRTKLLTGRCEHCGARIEFLAERIGLMAQCPRCRQTTELMLAPPRSEPGIPRRGLIWSLVAIVILLAGLVGALIALKRAQNWAARHKPVPAPAVNRSQ